jgi:hypothetical protein
LGLTLIRTSGQNFFLEIPDLIPNFGIRNRVADSRLVLEVSVGALSPALIEQIEGTILRT